MTDYGKAPLGAFRVFALILQGLVESLPYEQNLSRLEPYLPEILETFKAQGSYIDEEIAIELTDILETLTTKLKARKDELGDLAALRPLTSLLLEVALTTEGMLLLGKPEAVKATERFSAILHDLSDQVGVEVYSAAYLALLQELSESAVETWSIYELKVLSK